MTNKMKMFREFSRGQQIPEIGRHRIKVRDRCGSGGRATVFHADLATVNGQNLRVVVKFFDPKRNRLSLRHHSMPLASYEYLRNRQFQSLPGMLNHCAYPLGVCDFGDGRGQAFVQECLELETLGIVMSRHSIKPGSTLPVALVDTFVHFLMVAESHLFGAIDLASNNVFVDRTQRPWRPVLFDFNAIGDEAHNPLSRLACRLGYYQLGDVKRDWRRLTEFHEWLKRLNSSAKESVRVGRMRRGHQGSIVSDSTMGSSAMLST